MNGFLPKNLYFFLILHFNQLKTIIMKKLFAIMLALFAFVGVKANDGAFYAQGNQLIPINETTIKVQKEILNITLAPRVEDQVHRFKVNVYYEFFNPGEAKDLLVGFEAVNYREGDANAHPCIHDFKVVMNDKNLPHQVKRFFYPLNDEGYVDFGTIKDYYKNGRFVEPTKEQWAAIKDEKSPYYDWDAEPYYYVYYFNAHFNKGLNIIQHTYDFEGSDQVMEEYLFDYVLTAANRWANNGIDDFTLEINMGDRQSFAVQPTFFKSASEWTFTGKGKASEWKDKLYLNDGSIMFHVQSGSIVYHKKNFHPEGELHVGRDAFFIYRNEDFDETGFQDDDFVKLQYYNLHLFNEDESESALSTERKRILKNIPFAYRGYVFNDKGLQRYFESTNWYIPDPDYKSDMTTMSKNEQEWIQYWSK